MTDIFNHIDLKGQTSKKEAIVEGILNAITEGTLKKNDALPSVNKLMQKLGVARMTVVKSLNILKERGIIVSEDKVGYFVKDTNIKRELKVFLFLTSFSSYHETLYNSIIDELEGNDITIDLYFHHCNPVTFRSILHENIGSYGLYIITGFDDPQVKPALSYVPHRKLLQIIRPPLFDNISYICQDFYSGFKKSLEKLLPLLAKYNQFILVFPEGKGHPATIKTAFDEFCTDNNIVHRVENKITSGIISQGSAFGVIEDTDLFSLIKMGEKSGYRLGRDIGVFSYNETLMKEIIRDGITVISADFVQIGKSIARFITGKEPVKQIFEPEVIIRKSL